jgi:hypothetical protein
MGANSYVREATIPGGETLKTEAAPLCRAIMKYLTTLPAKFVVTWVFPSRDHVEAETKTSTNQALQPSFGGQSILHNYPSPRSRLNATVLALGRTRTQGAARYSYSNASSATVVVRNTKA